MAQVLLGTSSQCLGCVISWLSVSFFCFSRIISEKVKEVLFIRPRKYIRCSSSETTDPGYINITELAASVCRYDLDDMDMFWLQELNEDLTEMGKLFLTSKLFLYLTGEFSFKMSEPFNLIHLMAAFLSLWSYLNDAFLEMHKYIEMEQ